MVTSFAANPPFRITSRKYFGTELSTQNTAGINAIILLPNTRTRPVAPHTERKRTEHTFTPKYIEMTAILPLITKSLF